MLEEVKIAQKNLSWIDQDRAQVIKGERVRLKNLISCSPSFRQSILDMKINEALCIFMVRHSQMCVPLFVHVVVIEKARMEE